MAIGYGELARTLALILARECVPNSGFPFSPRYYLYDTFISIFSVQSCKSATFNTSGVYDDQKKVVTAIFQLKFHGPTHNHL